MKRTFEVSRGAVRVCKMAVNSLLCSSIRRRKRDKCRLHLSACVLRYGRAWGIVPNRSQQCFVQMKEHIMCTTTDGQHIQRWWLASWVLFFRLLLAKLSFQKENQVMWGFKLWDTTLERIRWLGMSLCFHVKNTTPKKLWESVFEIIWFLAGFLIKRICLHLSLSLINTKELGW